NLLSMGYGFLQYQTAEAAQKALRQLQKAFAALCHSTHLYGRRLVLEWADAEDTAFSSYPGSIFSGDDFYILSSGLVTLETTIGNSNPALWKFVHPKGTVMEWLRNIVANRLATTGKDWAEIFSKYNSGT
ncbi:hypothetical protein GOODEAATRI_010972, partial [Goodea atripinnis]